MARTIKVDVDTFLDWKKENEDGDLSWNSHPTLLFPRNFFPKGIKRGDIIDEGGCIVDHNFILIVAGISESLVYLKIVDLGENDDDYPDTQILKPIPKKEEGKYIL